MVAVQQSGSITPGHAVIWTTTGVVQDGGQLLAGNKVLASLIGADFNTTDDQPLALPQAITAFQLTGIIVTNPSVSLTTAVGGFYPAASKGTGPDGQVLVESTQVYSSLTAATKLLEATLVASVATTLYSRSNLTDWAVYLSLTTAQGSAATADVYIIGTDLTP